MSKKKKILVICSMVVLLVATAYVNVLLNSGENTPTPDTSSTEVTYFQSYRTTRETSRNQQITYLDGVIASAEVSADAKAAAETMKIDLVADMNTELVLEALIKSGGFSEAVVTVSDESLNVVVGSAELTSAEVAQIVTIVQSETDYTLDQITIRPYN